METDKRQRSYGLDAARAAAGILVLSVHFFQNYGFYDGPIAGKSMLLACVVRMLCMTCVPLFLLLTGYLCVNRRWGKGYYRKLLPILLTYLLAGSACLAFRAYWLKEALSFRDVVRSLADYSACYHSWYIEMYIGLFLLSPFFNAAWHSMDEAGKKALTLTLLVLTALPSLTNQLGPVLPDWWTEIYPLTFYAVGAWLREHPIRRRPWLLLACWLGLAALTGVKGYATAAGGAYAWMPEDNWKSLVLVAQAVCLFSCLIQCTGERVPAPARWCVSRVSKLSLAMYLTSYIAERLIYPALLQAVPAVHRRIWWMPVVVPAVVLCSLLLAQPIDWAVAALMRLMPTRKQDAANAPRSNTEKR